MGQGGKGDYEMMCHLNPGGEMDVGSNTAKSFGKQKRRLQNGASPKPRLWEMDVSMQQWAVNTFWEAMAEIGEGEGGHKLLYISYNVVNGETMGQRDKNIF